MKDSVSDVNKALAEMGEPPLGKGDVVQTRYVEDEQPTESPQPDVDDSKQIELIQPPGYRRSSLVFSNGSERLIDMQYEDLVERVRAFLAEPAADFLELENIQVTGADQQGNGGVVFSVPVTFSKRALELTLTSICCVYAKRAPGKEQEGGKGKIAVIRGGDASRVVMELNSQQRRRIERHN